MRRKFLLTSIVSMLALAYASMISAQDPRLAGVAGDKYVISAKAGGVNFVAGTVSVVRKDGTSGHLLMGDELQIGDRVTTAADGKAEILLNPGSYLRVGGNTAFEFVSTDLENLRINLKSGSAVFEVIAADEFRVSVKMPQTEVALTRSGVFRLDVLADGTAKISVFKGKAYVGPAGQTEVASGRTAMLVKGGISVSKFDRGTNDALDIWSKERGKELSKANAQLQRNSLRNTLLTSFNHRGWNMYNSFGLWVFDPFYRRWCFLPFGYGWSSPYGWGYDFDIWSCRLPWYVYREPYYPPNSGGGGTGGGSTGSRVTPIVSAGDRRAIPPFERIQGTGGGGGSSSRSSDNNVIINSGRGRDSSPPMSSPSSSPASTPPIVSPPPASTETVKGKPGN
jgi:FecR protein